MKDQVTALMEALRLLRVETEKLRRGKQSMETTVEAIEAILREPHVVGAVASLEPFVEAPTLVPEAHDASGDAAIRARAFANKSARDRS